MKIRLKSIIYAWLAIMLGALLAFGVMGCRMTSKTKPVIAVTIPPQKYLLDRLVGSQFTVECLLAPGANPESYEPSLNNMVALEHSKAFFTIGNIGFEAAIMDKIHNNNASLKVYNNSNGIALLHDGHGGTGEVDPHVWVSVRNARVIAFNMYEAMLELDPKHKHYYKKRYDKLVADLDKLDSKFKEKLQPVRNRTFVAWHPALGYLARDYSLRQIALTGDEKEQSPMLLKQRIDTARRSGAKVLFYPKQMDKAQMESIASDLGATKAVPLTPLSGEWDSELTTIVDAIAEQ